MNPYPSCILLNGKSRQVNELLEMQRNRQAGRPLSGHAAGTSSPSAGWLDFLAEWYAPGTTISVQTSGSTGPPKTIRLTKSFVRASALRTLQYFKLHAGDRVLLALSTRYIAGKLMVVRALTGELDLHVSDPGGDFALLDRQTFAFAALTPNQAVKILDGERGIRRLQQIRQLLLGGSSIPGTLRQRLQNMKTACYSGYAMTETATHIAINRINGKEADAWYHCLEAIRVSLSDEGCLRIRMRGLKDPFLQTTDRAKLKDEKTFKILGRADHRIICGGLKYTPEQLEQKLEAELNRPFLISSEPHDKLGEQIVLLVEGKAASGERSRIRDICARILDKYERPRQIRFVSSLPRTPNGKIKRR
ncbi:MAG: AMP-binding protein [Mangrovibacterium sp.]